MAIASHPSSKWSPPAACSPLPLARAVLRRAVPRQRAGPIVDTRAPDTGPGHVVLVEGEGCLLGLQFYGTPYVVDLDETEHALLAIERRPSFPSGTLPLLDIDAVAKALLALD